MALIVVKISNPSESSTNSPELVINLDIILLSQPFQAGVQIFFIMAFLRQHTLFTAWLFQIR